MSSAKAPEYDSLDYQLADLLAQLNKKQHKLIEQVTLDISKQTRDGHIALACPSEIREELLSSKVVGTKEDYTPLVLENGFIYLRRYWLYQQRLAQQINTRLERRGAEPEVHWIKQRLAYYFSHDNPTHGADINWQQTAAALALTSHFLIISGGPGTGKTTTITRILSLLIEQHQRTHLHPLRFSLAAPTGKAAMRMSESIRESIQREGGRLTDKIKQQLPEVSSTIHRLLGYRPNRTTFRFNKNNPLATDVVIIDEASMIDLALMTKLFEAVPPQATLILLGDKDQLSSVETGSVFTDLCASANNHYTAKTTHYLQAVTEAVHQTTAKDKITRLDHQIVCLLKSWRFDQASGIGRLAACVNKNRAEDALIILNDVAISDIQLIPPSDFTISDLLSSWQPYLQALKETLSIDDLFAEFNRFRMLSALRKGMKGSVYLNAQLEKQLMQQNKLYTDKRWYHGRPVMITENSYRTGLFNGDIGIVLQDQLGQTKVWFKTKEGAKAFSPVRLPRHETAWVMTIHKSQGSEFERVCVILPTEDNQVLTRQLIYTGITRAKQQIDIVSAAHILTVGIERVSPKATQIQSLLL